MSWYEGLVEWLRSVLGPFVSLPPFNTIFVLLLALAVSVIATGAQRLMLDVKVLRQQAQELSRWRKEILKAHRERDLKTVEKLMKRKPYMDKLQAKYTIQTMKPALAYTIPLIVLYWIFMGVFDKPVAYLPLIGSPIPFWIWYLITYSGFYPIMQRVLKVDFQSSD
ncbi:MAG: EMC3/TMCO1 family protein [Candidatus Nezhaarchaeota archaeon]|nr:EMC3/TMCO1 family protein [Candidatus Nezhaarchaeota archaeon]MCX8142151.1 EMC3/TMCO1 family protein [Candidatus Nezhaarchaeota archaeon]MDW8050066.1 EMC3/TMCO1 family protein [Nitrososphaerota archaeon]